MRRLTIPLTLAGLALCGLGLTVSLTGEGSATTTSTLSLLAIICLAQLAWYSQRLALSLALLLPVLAVLLVNIASYAMPSAWLARGGLGLTQWLALFGNASTWLLPNLPVSLLLVCLAASLALRTRSSLGTPLLHAIAATMWAVVAHRLVSPSAMPPVVPQAGGMALFIEGLLLLTQFVGVVSGWRHQRTSLARGLVPSLLITSFSILLWVQQDNEANQQLIDRAQREANRMSTAMAARVDGILRAVNRFHMVWEIEERLPSDLMWRHEAQSFTADFPELALLALLDASGRVQHLYADDGLHAAYHQADLLDGSHDGEVSDLLQQSLRQPDSVSSAMVSLPGEDKGIISFLPIHAQAEGRLLGSVATMFSLDTLASEALPPLPETAEELTVTLRQDGQVLWQTRTNPTMGPWHLYSQVHLLDQTLALELVPGRALLGQLRLRYPASTLCSGLIMALLLYQLLFSRHQQRQQHRQISKANVELRQEMRRRTRLQKNVEWLADHDDLTGLANRRKFLASLPADASASPLSLLLCDLDHFKRINDQQGHGAGDQALRRFATVARELVPASGILARYGGEEFVICLPQGDRDGVLHWANRLKQAVAACGVRHTDGSPLTVCIGVVIQTQGPVVPKDLLRRADLALYRAKRGGRNRVEVAEPPPAPETVPATTARRVLPS